MSGPRVPPLPLLIGLVAVFVGATAYGEYESRAHDWFFALELVIGVAVCAGLPALFRWPVPTAAVLTALAAIAPTATPLSTIATLHVARFRQLPAAVAIGVAGIGAHTVRGLWLPTGGLTYAWWVTLMVATHAGLVGWGAMAATRAALIDSLRERALRAEAEQGRRVAEARAAERAGLAREMHDVLAHRLSLAATYAGALEYRPDVAPERLAQAAGVLRTTVHQALNELRDVITLLRDDDGLDGDRPVPALTDLPELVAESRASGTPVEVRERLTDPATLPGTTARTAYRVLQEALTNARKHAPGQPVSIALDGTPGERLLIDVSNPLSGTTTTTTTIPGTGAGLVGLTERVRLAGGQLDHQASAAEFRLHAWLPWPA